MKSKGLFQLLSLIFAFAIYIPSGAGEFTFGDAPPQKWSKIYDISIDSIVKTPDGGFQLAGVVSDNSWFTPKHYLKIIKTDSTGNKQWEKTGIIGELSGFKPTSDGGYVTTHLTSEYSTTESKLIVDTVLIKLNPETNIQWSKTFGGTGRDFAIAMQISDTGYILFGRTDSYEAGSIEAWLIKTDAEGSMQWSKTYKEGIYNTFIDAQQTSDGGFILPGLTNSETVSESADPWMYGLLFFNDVLLIKTDANGNRQWIKTFTRASMGKTIIWSTSVRQTLDGGYIIAGGAAGTAPEEITNPNREILLIKTDSNGNKQWSKIFGDDVFGTFRAEDVSSIIQTQDEGFVLYGASRETTKDGDSNGFIIKTDKNGIVSWAKLINESGVSSMIVTPDGGYVLSAGNSIMKIGGNNSAEPVFESFDNSKPESGLLPSIFSVLKKLLTLSF